MCFCASTLVLLLMGTMTGFLLGLVVKTPRNRAKVAFWMDAYRDRTQQVDNLVKRVRAVTEKVEILPPYENNEKGEITRSKLRELLSIEE